MDAMDDTRLQQLIGILFDESARLDERDDAAIDLGRSDDPRAIDALLRVGASVGESDMLVGSCGESLGEIAVRIGRFDRRWPDMLRPEARRELIAMIRADRPDLLSGG